jgi:TonB family protein
MRAPTELWEKLEGRVIEGKFPLRRWLGGSDHSAVFLTERSGKESQKAAIKLVSADTFDAETLDEDAQLSRWADTAMLSHPHLIRLFECGRTEIEGTRFLYVVMEYAEEDLAQILPQRPLSPEEVTEMLPPTAEALAFLHRAGFAHGRIKPSNIMAVENQLKISTDGLRKTGDIGDATETSAYAAPEVSTDGVSPAADVWSVGVMLVAVLTQHEPKLSDGDRGQVTVPETISEPFREIARQCLHADPWKRSSVSDILSKVQAQEPTEAHAVEDRMPKERTKLWVVAPIAAVLLLAAALIGSRFIGRQPRIPPAETPPSESQTVPADAPAAQSQAPFAEKVKPARTAEARGSVLQQVLPDVSRSAQNTITGRVKVNVRVAVDASGNVSQATVTPVVQSKYFAKQALAAARRWKFNPPQVNGQATSSEWLLRFQFGRMSTQVFPSEINP